jgi:hypothetical protein
MSSLPTECPKCRKPIDPQWTEVLAMFDSAADRGR